MMTTKLKRSRYKDFNRYPFLKSVNTIVMSDNSNNPKNRNKQSVVNAFISNPKAEIKNIPINGTINKNDNLTILFKTTSFIFFLIILF